MPDSPRTGDPPKFVADAIYARPRYRNSSLTLFTRGRAAETGL